MAIQLQNNTVKNSSPPPTPPPVRSGGHLIFLGFDTTKSTALKQALHEPHPLNTMKVNKYSFMYCAPILSKFQKIQKVKGVIT